MIREHDRIVLNQDIPEKNLKSGDVGTVIHISQDGRGFVVEFATLKGETACVAPLDHMMVRPIGEHEMIHARLMAG